MPRLQFLSASLALAFGISLAWPGSARATDYFWSIPTTGNFTHSARWAPFNPGPFDPKLGPGGVEDTVNFDLGMPTMARYAVTDVAGQNDQLLVHNDSLSLDFTGNYTLVNASFDNPSFAVGVAHGDVGDVLLTGSGTLQTEFTSIGHAPGSSGTATVSGLDWGGHGSLLVGYAGTGSLTIENGSTVSSSLGIIGQLSGSIGEVTVTGVDSTWNLDEGFAVGTRGSGSLTIAEGGAVHSGILTHSPSVIGNNPGAVGEVTVTGTGSEWNQVGNISIGHGGGVGSLTVEEGGRVVSSNVDVSISGSVAVRGTGSYWSTDHLATFGGNASITVEAGATVETKRTYLDLTTTVDGAGTTWNMENDNEEAAVGHSSSGMLTVSGGAHLSVSKAFYLGVFSSGKGTVLVTGEGSTLNSVELLLGAGGGAASGVGTLTIADGGTVGAHSAYIGLEGGSSITVTGVGSRFDVQTDLSVRTGTLHVLPGGDAIVGNELRVGDQGTILLEGGRLAVNHFGEGGLEALDWQSGTLRLINAGGLTVGAGGLFGEALLLNKNQHIEVAHALTLESGTVLFSPSGFKAGSTLIEAGSQMFVGSAEVGTGLTNHGDLVFTSAASVSGPVANSAGGTITALGDLVFTHPVDGQGAFYGPGTITFAGGFSPGASPAEVAIEGNVVLAGTNTLFIEIGGTSPGSEFDLVTIGGTATLAGLLEVSLIDGFLPTSDQEFTVLTAANLVDQGLSLGGPAASLFELIVNPTSLVLQARSPSLLGDYNGDGMVDAADYLVWRNTLGSTTNLAADGNDNGEIDAADYTVWKDNYGNTLPAASAIPQAAVPEPASLLLVGLIGMFAAGPFRLSVRRG